MIFQVIFQLYTQSIEKGFIRGDSLFRDGGPLSYRNQPIDLLCKSMDWFLYDMDLRHERVKKELINPFLANVPILYLLEPLENESFFWYFQGV